MLQSAVKVPFTCFKIIASCHSFLYLNSMMSHTIKHWVMPNFVHDSRCYFTKMLLTFIFLVYFLIHLSISLFFYPADRLKYCLPFSVENIYQWLCQNNGLPNKDICYHHILLIFKRHKTPGISYSLQKSRRIWSKLLKLGVCYSDSILDWGDVYLL